jgi:hypothetical protein
MRRVLLVLVSLAALAAASPAVAARSFLSTRCSVAAGANARLDSATDPVSFNYPYSAGPTSAFTDAASQTARGLARAEYADGKDDDCTTDGLFKNMLAVDAGTSGRNPGEPVTLRLTVLLTGLADGGGLAAGAPFLSSVDMNASYALTGERICGVEGCSAENIARLTWSLRRVIDAFAGSPGDPDGSLTHDIRWGWDLSSNAAEPQGDSANLYEEICSAWPCATGSADPRLRPFPIPVGAQTIDFVTKVGAKLAIEGRINTLAQARRAPGFATGSILDTLHVEISPAPGFEGLELTYETSPPPPPPPPSGPCILVEPKTDVDFGTATFSTGSGPMTKTGSPDLTVTSCADAAETVSVRAGNATGGSAPWSLDDSVANPCAAGVDIFALALGDLRLSATDKTWASLAAGASKSVVATLTMPCTGSSGVGETMTSHVVFTATT